MPMIIPPLIHPRFVRRVRVNAKTQECGRGKEYRLVQIMFLSLLALDSESEEVPA